MASRFFFLSVLLLVAHALAEDYREGEGQKFAVILAGANDYDNYFSQADACHSYHTLRDGGIPASNIIHLNYDDIANSNRNPFPHNLVNVPGGPNIYPGCEIDYRGKDVSPEVLLAILEGNKTAIRHLTGKDGKVLESGPDDDVFLTFVDHGGPGFFCFPDFTKELHAQEMVNAFKSMHHNKQYRRMVVYMESCHSGSMFAGILPDNLNIYGVSNANPDEPGYMCCFDDKRGVYVGSYFSNTWTYDTDGADRENMTLRELFRKEKAGCRKNPSQTSHPQQYGDLSLRELPVAEFMGKGKQNSNGLGFTPEARNQELSSLSAFMESPPIDMAVIALTMRRLLSKDLSASRKLQLKQKLDLNLKIKKFAEDVFGDMAKTAALFDKKASPEFFMSNQGNAQDYLCYKQALRQVDAQCPVLEKNTYPFITRNYYALINICNRFGSGAVNYAIEKATFDRAECKTAV